MLFIKHILNKLEGASGLECLSALYGDQADICRKQQERYIGLCRQAATILPADQEALIGSSPGRIEIGGNHTDHENGVVLAAAIQLDTIGIAVPNDTDTIHILSRGYQPIDIRLDDSIPRPEERGTSSALVRGICRYLQGEGWTVRGFDAVFDSTIPAGSGLSSSASFELLTSQLVNALYNKGQIAPLALARAGHYAEVEYFQKPSGLLDQVTCAIGGLLFLDFLKPMDPEIKRLDPAIVAGEYKVVATMTGGSHAEMTDEYRSIVNENKEIADFFNVTSLRQVNAQKLQDRITGLRERAGDRAILRAMHYFDENLRTQEMVTSMERCDFERFLALVNQSGDSSWMLLQNCYQASNPASQGIPLGLTISKRILGVRGAVRVHGGGFAGTIMAFVPPDLLEPYIHEMERVFGRKACLHLWVRNKGASTIFI
jgi:galactokinase